MTWVKFCSPYLLGFFQAAGLGPQFLIVNKDLQRTCYAPCTVRTFSWKADTVIKPIVQRKKWRLREVVHSFRVT